MTCTFVGRAILCSSPSYRLRLDDGRYVFMSWHHYSGPFFYKDKLEQREIENWYEDDLICRALSHFIKRGKVI